MITSLHFNFIKIRYVLRYIRAADEKNEEEMALVLKEATADIRIHPELRSIK